MLIRFVRLHLRMNYSESEVHRKYIYEVFYKIDFDFEEIYQFDK